MPRVACIVHEQWDGPLRLGSWLSEAGVEVDAVEVWRGEGLPSLTSYDGLVVMGGAMGAADDEVAPWLPAVRSLLASAAALGVPTLGVCLGHQLLALSCGGEVGRRQGGPEIGLGPVRLLPAAADDPVLSALPAESWSVQWHHDVVSRPPDGAEVLATGLDGDVQAMRVGEAAWGVQFHPEVSPSIFAAWAEQDTGDLAARGVHVARLQGDVEAADDTLVAHGRALATAFAQVVTESISLSRVVGVTNQASQTSNPHNS